MPFKHEHVAEVGDTIRAYDFPGRTDCYIQGKIIDKDIEGRHRGFASFVIEVEVDGWPEATNHSRVGLTAYVPMEVAFMDWDGRIEKC